MSKRIIGTGITVILTLIGLLNLPEDIAKWTRRVNEFLSSSGIDWTAFWMGSGGRWSLVLLGIGVGLWTWDVPNRFRARFRPHSPNETRVVKGRPASNDMFEDAKKTVKNGRPIVALERDLAASQQEVLNVRSVLDEKLRDTERIREVLSKAVRTAEDKFRATEQALQICKREFALAKIRWLGEQTRNPAEPWGFFQVTIQIADPRDRDLAEQIAGILHQHTDWHPIRVDPTLRALKPSDEYKVVFEYDQQRRRFEPLFQAFIEGNLLNCSIGVANQADSDLLILVLPTVVKV